MSDPGNQGGFSWKAWVLGIIGGVATALLIALLTPWVTSEKDASESDSSPLREEARQPFEPAAPPRTPDVRILNVPRIITASVGQAEGMQLQVFNEGNTAAEGCQVQLGDESGRRLSNSSFFGLQPGASETVAVSLPAFDARLELESVAVQAVVDCTNGRSPAYRTVVALLPGQ